MKNDDVFEFDAAAFQIVEKAVENRELDNATESLKDDVEDSLDQNFNQFNFEQVLQKRDQVVKSIQQVLSPKLDGFEKMHERIVNREDEEGFKADRRDNAIDTDDYDSLRDAYDLLREIHSQTTLMWYVAHANSSDVAKAVEIRQMQADQQEVMDKVNEHYNKFESAADKISQEMRDGIEKGMESALRKTFDEAEERIEELEEKVEERDERIEELEDSQSDLVNPQDLEPLTEDQEQIYDYLRSNPDAEDSEVAEATGAAPNQVPMQISRIESKGWPIP